MKLEISANNRTLLREGEHFFYLADTCWSAFTSIKEEEWLVYLKKRQSQGFNTLQINILPQWDRSHGAFDLLPFQQKNGCYDFSVWEDRYFERAQTLCRIAQEHGFTLALVVLWSNYVSGTWASELDKGKNILPKENRQQYFEKVIATFDSFDPIYFIGGDTDFPTQATIDTYLEAFDFFEKHSVNTLKTIHIKGRLQEIPEEIIKHLDFYLYQSGHNSSFPNIPYVLAEHFYQWDDSDPSSIRSLAMSKWALQDKCMDDSAKEMFGKQHGSLSCPVVVQELPMAPMGFGAGIEIQPSLLKISGKRLTVRWLGRKPYNFPEPMIMDL